LKSPNTQQAQTIAQQQQQLMMMMQQQIAANAYATPPPTHMMHPPRPTTITKTTISDGQGGIKGISRKRRNLKPAGADLKAATAAQPPA